jgi:beta-N-acetylhexosaminidase
VLADNKGEGSVNIKSVIKYKSCLIPWCIKEVYRKSLGKLSDKMRLVAQISKNLAFVLSAFLILMVMSPSRAICMGSTKVDPVAERVKLMTLNEKVGQVFLLGFTGKTFQSGLGQKIKTYKPGGILVFGRNIRSAKQISRMLHQAQNQSHLLTQLPLFIAVDQEGGDVTRIKTHPPMPSALAMATTESPKLIEEIGFETGNILSMLGFNLNLAPVVDLSDPQEASFVGSRSFGDNPQQVAKMSLAFSAGLRKSGVLVTAKHYPGHGGTLTDSHKATPISQQSLEDLATRDLQPYQFLIKKGSIDAVMLAHIAFPRIDQKEIPATYSKPLIEDLLRKELKYEGLVLTDDLEMSGAAAIPTVEERVITAFNSGADLLMLAWNPKAQKKAFRAIRNAVKNGRISQERLYRSVYRIVNAKMQKLPQRTLRRPSSIEIKNALSSDSFQRITYSILKKNFQKGVSKVDSTFFKNKYEPVLAISASRTFLSQLRKFFPKNYIRTLHIYSRKNQARVPSIVYRHPDAKIIYHITGRQTAKTLTTIPKHRMRNVLVINSQYPGIINTPKSYYGVINTSTRHPQTARVLIDHFKKIQKNNKDSSVMSLLDEDQSTRSCAPKLGL